MDIGIIGAGHIGATSARLLMAAGHRVAIANSRGPETLSELVASIDGPIHAARPEEAAAFGEVVLVAIPFGRYRLLPVDPMVGKVVIDATNYYPDRDGALAILDEDTETSSALVEAHLVKARLVKAVNTIWSERLAREGRPAGDPERLAIPVAGDDAEAKQIVIGLLDDMGFDGVDNGHLEEGGRRQQPGTAVYNEPLTASEVRERLGLDG